MQGWLLSRALPADQMASWLSERQAEYLARTQTRRFTHADPADLPVISIPAAPRDAGPAPVASGAPAAEPTA
jgi:hypothetical protein